MTDFFRRVFSEGFLPHGRGDFWNPEIVRVHHLFDAFVAVSR